MLNNDKHGGGPAPWPQQDAGPCQRKTGHANHADHRDPATLSPTPAPLQSPPRQPVDRADDHGH
jgi:hypothetical protein